MNSAPSAISHMSSLPSSKAPPLISTAASIWAPKPYTPAQPHHWPEQVASWPSMSGHPLPSQSQVLNERTNMHERGRAPGLNENALVVDRERRQRVGAIGEGRQNGNGPATSIVRAFLDLYIPSRVGHCFHTFPRSRPFISFSIPGNRVAAVRSRSLAFLAD
ncbi:uncharacterized protein EI90DRAFT_3044271 [Cantharellus anzutake]|uniref:uncharacterized protein n=1 Tax=Cantharellus anzutake TaxID=1750568 RepID=UPI0019059505|nr:uncharacterized protein EI90DRAFT_3044271 [Cantharellus anzutake]KAF8336944.1 hypothetical protein EI90DRAFT_3044271 [Cantharellus anzutake]